MTWKKEVDSVSASLYGNYSIESLKRIHTGSRLVCLSIGSA
jgi:hypothetical protein